VAADFEYQVPGKEVQRMHNLRTPYTLLFFSNPECPMCEEIIGSFMASDVLNQAIETQQLTLLNLYIDQELDRWMNYRHHFPKTWINAFDPNFSLRDNDRYAIRAIPSLYLLDSEKRVLLKDATPQQVVRALQSMR
jgi:thioredoxin-related protein